MEFTREQRRDAKARGRKCVPWRCSQQKHADAERGSPVPIINALQGRPCRSAAVARLPRGCESRPPFRPASRTPCPPFLPSRSLRAPLPPSPRLKSTLTPRGALVARSQAGARCARARHVRPAHGAVPQAQLGAARPHASRLCRLSLAARDAGVGLCVRRPLEPRMARAQRPRSLRRWTSPSASPSRCTPTSP